MKKRILSLLTTLVMVVGLTMITTGCNSSETNATDSSKQDNIKKASTPIQVSGSAYSTAIETITEDGSLYTWGENKYGQLGNGTRKDSTVPIKISIPADNPADAPSTPGQSRPSGSAHRRDEAASQDEAQGATPGQGETPAARDFADVAAGSWYEGGVSFVVERGLFQGVAEGRFAPEVPMTRAMLMTVLARLDGQDTASGGVWYQVGVDWAVAAGVSDGAAPDALVTREQLAVMLYRYAQRLGLPTAGRDSLRSFADGGQIAPWAQDAMAWAVDQGVLHGRSGGVLDPAASATRAEAAAMLQRFAALLPG